VWGYPDVPTTRSVDHAIARLRKKIEPDPHHPQFIHTVQGSGYCLTPQGRSAASEAAGEHGAGSSPA
jgi:DNA-binding response OmpR family regulator